MSGDDVAQIFDSLRLPEKVLASRVHEVLLVALGTVDTAAGFGVFDADVNHAPDFARTREAHDAGFR